jgi:hypothetical protein
MFREIPIAEIVGRLRRGVVVDGRNTLDHRALALAGVRYRGVGRKAMPMTSVVAGANDISENVAV